MNRFKNQLIVAAVLSVLAIIGTIMNSQQAVAQGPPGGMAVRIVDPLPVPITGSTTVSGTVAATQSGGWSVGINGTPNVNVTNPATAPVLSLNLSDPGRIPYQSEVNSSGGGCTASACIFTFGPVPANHRLVVEDVTGLIHFTSAQAAALVTVNSSSSGFKLLSAFQAPITAGSLSQNFAAFDQPVHFYVDPTQSFTVTIVTTFLNFDTTSGQAVTVAGYLLDCTAGPCASIASF
jgi:hypothetical protein